MTDLFGRVATIQVGEQEISGLRVAFVVRRSGRGFDGAEIQVWGLSLDRYGALGRPDTTTRLVAGYAARHGLVIAGTTVRGSLQRVIDGGEAVTVWQVQEAARGLARTSLSRSWRGQVSASEVVAQVATDAGLSWTRGDLPRDPTYARGYTILGTVRQALDTLAADCGCTWGIQGGRLVLLPIGDAARTRIPLLTPGSGLVGYPEQQDRGRVRAVSLLDPGLLPGDRYSLGGDWLAGDYIAETVEHRGDLYGAPWYTTVTGRPVA